MEGVARLVCRTCDPSGGTTFAHLPDGTPIGPANFKSRQIKNTGDFDVEVDFNQFGFRDRKLLDAASAESLFVVGDSFAFGWGVEEDQRFSDRLEVLLGAPVFNIAAGAADFEGYETLIHYAEDHLAHIDHLVVSVCMENDIHVYSMARPSQSFAQADEVRPFATIGDFKGWLAQHSALRFAATRAVHSTPWLKRAAISAGLLTPNAQDATVSDVSDEAVTSSVRRLHRLIEARHAVVLVIPSRGLWIGQDDHRKAVRATHLSFVSQLRATGIAVVDILSVLESGDNPLAYHFANDGHWNPRGHRLAAYALVQHLLDH